MDIMIQHEKEKKSFSKLFEFYDKNKRSLLNLSLRLDSFSWRHAGDLFRLKLKVHKFRSSFYQVFFAKVLEQPAGSDVFSCYVG